MLGEILLIPIVVVVVALALLIAGLLFARNYIKVSPNVVAVLSGRKRKLPDGRVVGYRMVKGGAALRIPLLEKVEYFWLNVMTIPLEIRRAYTLKGVPVSVKAVAFLPRVEAGDIVLIGAISGSRSPSRTRTGDRRRSA